MQEPPWGRSTRWEPGVEVAGFRLLDRIGEGGMGSVFLARHVASGADYALKTLGAGDPELVLRFQREIEAQARVDRHPNVLRIHSAGADGGRVFYCMDLATGGDLEQRLRAGPLPSADAARLVRDLARGLEHVHAHGILHRDLKPQNVVFDDQGTPKLVDFGLAKVTGTDTLTQTGEILGTPAYMAPEQALGLRDDLDVRTDVYALGAVLFAALTGEPPFQGRRVVDLLQLVIHTPPTPPSRLAGSDPSLDPVVLRCLAKAPDDRYPTARALADALDRWLSGDRPRASRLGPLAAAAVATSVLAAIALWGPPPAPPPHPTPSADAAAVAGGGVAEVASGDDLADSAGDGSGDDEGAAPATAASPPDDGWLSDAVVQAPWLDPDALDRRLDAVCAEIGAPASTPPYDLPDDLRGSWVGVLTLPVTAVPFAQGLRERGLNDYARQMALYGAQNGNPVGWVDLARWRSRPGDPAAADPQIARACWRRAALSGDLAYGSYRLGDVAMRRFQAQGELVDLRRAARWFLDGVDRQADGEEDHRSRCAEGYAKVQHDLEQLGEPADFERALALTKRRPDDAYTKLRTEWLARKLGRSEEAVALVGTLEAALVDSPAGDEAAVRLARLLREGWGEVEPDPVAAQACLMRQLARSRVRPPSWDKAPPLRLRYQAARGLAGLAGDVPGDPALAMTLWEEVAELDSAQGWLRVNSLRDAMVLGAGSDDPALRRRGAHAAAALRAAADAGSGLARRLLDGGD